MDRMLLVVVFDSEREAYEGTRILKELHAEGSITLYGQTVIAKDASGKVTVKAAEDSGPLGTAVGMVTGALVGLIGGPVGVAVGMAAGTFGGARTAKLREARELRMEAWKLTRAAVIPDARDDINVRRPLGPRR